MKDERWLMEKSSVSSLQLANRKLKIKKEERWMMGRR